MKIEDIIKDALVVAREIMDLVDETPSGPFSLERRDVEKRIEEMLLKFADIAEDAKNSYYQVGYDDGREEAQEELFSQIEDLEEQIQDLQTELQDKYDEGYDDGYQVARERWE